MSDDARQEQVQPGGRCGGLEGAAAQRGGLPAWDLFPSQGEINSFAMHFDTVLIQSCVCKCCVVVVEWQVQPGSMKFERMAAKCMHGGSMLQVEVVEDWSLFAA